MPHSTVRRLALATTALAVCLTTAACSSDDGGDAADDASTPATSSATASESASASESAGATESTETPSESATMLTDEQVTPALLVPDDFGGYGFTIGQSTDDDSPLPCADPGSPGIDAQVPPQATGSTELDNNAVQAVIAQDIQVYDTPALATKVWTLLQDGLGCTDGVLPDGTAITIGASQDVTSQVNTDGIGTSTAWQFGNDKIKGVIVASQSQSVVTDVIFIAAKDANEKKLPNPLGVAKIAFAKILTH